MAEYDYITTYTGVHFYPLKPIKEDIRLEDMAHALALLCRGNGHVRCFYSVGEHCINCALEADARGYSTRVKFACLLHDASECYMSDVPSPFKKTLEDYCENEARLLSCIYEKFLGSDLTEAEMQLVEQVDKDLLKYDLYHLLREGSQEKLPILQRHYGYGERTYGDTEEAYRFLAQCYTRELGK